jgi:hypothetical protein
VSDHFRRKREFDYFLKHLIEGRACTEGPRGLKYYDMLHRAVCRGELADFDAGPGPYYPIVFAAHHLWRRGDVCAACALLVMLRGKKPLFHDVDETTAATLLEVAIRSGARGVRHVKTDDSVWSWAALFKYLLIAELNPTARAEALRRIRKALEEVFEAAADLTEEIIDGYNIILPPKAPYAYIHHAVEELERLEPPKRGIRSIFQHIFRKKEVNLSTLGSSPVYTQLSCLWANQ